MKKQLLIALFSLLSVISIKAQSDTVYVSIASDTYGTVRFRTLHSGTFVCNQYDPTKVANSYLTLDTIGVDSIHLIRTSTGAKLKSWDLTRFYFKVLGNTQLTVDKLNWTYFTKPNYFPLIRIDSVQRDSLFNYGLAPKGTMIMNISVGNGAIEYVNKENQWEQITIE